MSANSQLIHHSLLLNLVPIKSLSPDHCQELAEKSDLFNADTGKYLFKEGENAEHVYYVIKGNVDLNASSGESKQVVGGTKTASLPLEQNKVHRYTAIARTNVTYLRVDANLLDIMLTWEQSGGYEVQELASDGEQNQDADDWMSRILQAQVFHRIPPANIQSIFMRMQPEHFNPGEAVIKQGDEGDRFYIIRDGMCSVVRKTRKNPEGVMLAQLGVGDNFGEEALISGGKRNASVIVQSGGQLMSLAKSDFLELMNAPLLNWVSFADAKTISQNGGIWIDVRLPSEYQPQHLIGSINLPLPILRSKMGKLDKNKEYIVCCDTGRRSSTAAYLLGQNGYNAYVLTDGTQVLPMDEFAFSD